MGQLIIVQFQLDVFGKQHLKQSSSAGLFVFLFGDFRSDCPLDLKGLDLS